MGMKRSAICFQFLFYLFCFLLFVMADENEKVSAPQDQEPFNQDAGLDAIMVRGSPSGNTASSKTAWPEVVGLTAEDAEKKIKEDMPHATVQVVPPDHFVTMDFRSNRVRLFLNSAGSVARPATVG